MNKIKVVFEVGTKCFGKTRFEKEAIELVWAETDTTTIDTVYIQVYNAFNHYVFHTFMSEKKAVHKVPLRIHEDPSQYRVFAYGMKENTESPSPCYIIQNAASSALDCLLTQGEDLGKLLLVQNFDYNSLKDSEQSSYGIDVEASDLSEYVFTGFQERAFYIIFLHQLHSRNTYLLVKIGNGINQATIPFNLQPACEFSFQCFRVQKGNETSFLGRSHSTVCKFRTYMTTSQVQQLLHKAIQFVGLQSYTLHLTHFYRNKSYEYFSNIMTKSAGVMAKYVKNWGGDPFSTLNQKLHGLFFSAVVDPKTLLPPTVSYYGPIRLYIPTPLLLNDSANLYFSDFYCHYFRHKVQLVITKKGSNSDYFCSTRLIKLNPFNNPFWKTFLGNLFVTTNVTVEVFYTEDIPITEWQQYYNGIYFEQTETIGDALTMVVGIPKKEDCTICNLDHVVQARMQNQNN